jgi:hypothetical protein
MIALARIAGIAVGVAIFGGLMWLIWEKLAPPKMAAYILSVLSLYLSLVAGALCGEHFLRFLRIR